MRVTLNSGLAVLAFCQGRRRATKLWQRRVAKEANGSVCSLKALPKECNLPIAFGGVITDTETLLRTILEEGLEAVNATRGTISLVDHRTGELVTKFVAGIGWTERQPDLRFQVTDAPGHSISSYVAFTGQPYLCPDVTQDPHYYPLFPDTRSELAVPLIGRGGRVLGVLNVESEKGNAFGEKELKVLSALASIASLALSLADYQNRERALVELGKELAAATDIDALLERVTEVAAHLLDADDCSLFLVDKSINRLVLRASRGLLRSLVGQATYRFGEGLTGWVALHNKPARLNGVMKTPDGKGSTWNLIPRKSVLSWRCPCGDATKC